MGVARIFFCAFLCISIASCSGVVRTAIPSTSRSSKSPAKPSRVRHDSVNPTNAAADGYVVCQSVDDLFCIYSEDVKEGDCTVNLTTDLCSPNAPAKTGTAGNGYRNYIECIDHYADNKIRSMQVTSGTLAYSATQTAVQMEDNYANEDEVDGTDFIVDYLTDPNTATTWFASFGTSYPADVNAMEGDLIAAGNAWGAYKC